jgi:hypothetical protein
MSPEADRCRRCNWPAPHNLAYCRNCGHAIWVTQTRCQHCDHPEPVYDFLEHHWLGPFAKFGLFLVKCVFFLFGFIFIAALLKH